LVYAKYIKRKGKKFGPYYYTSIRDENGRVRNIYVGRTLEEAEALSKKLLAGHGGKSPVEIGPRARPVSQNEIHKVAKPITPDEVNPIAPEVKTVAPEPAESPVALPVPPPKKPAHRPKTPSRHKPKTTPRRKERRPAPPPRREPRHEQRREYDWTRDVRPMVTVAIVLIAFLTISLFPIYTGLLLTEKQYTDPLNLTLTGNQTYEWQPMNTGTLKSLSLSGRAIGNGDVRVYLKVGNESLLVFENTVEDYYIIDVTGYATYNETNGTSPEDNQTVNITEPMNETNVTIPEENVTYPEENVTEPAINETLPEPPPEDNATANITIPEDNQTINITLPEDNETINMTEPINETKHNHTRRERNGQHNRASKRNQHNQYEDNTLRRHMHRDMPARGPEPDILHPRH